MNTLLYNNRNGCFKMCNTCKDDDKLYRYELKINQGTLLQGYIDFIKINEEGKLIYSFAKDNPIRAKTDGKYWYQWDPDNNKWIIFDQVNTYIKYDQYQHSYRTIIKCGD